MHYHLKTYLFWALVINIRVLRFLEFYLFLLPLRPLVNFLVKILAHRLRINLILEFNGELFEDKEEKDLLRVKHPSTFIRIINEGPLGLAESYVEGWWEFEGECEKLAVKIDKLFGNVRIVHPFLWVMDWVTLNSDQGQRPWEESSQEWTRELGKKVFEGMMGPTKSYTCGHWDDHPSSEISLESAQTANYHKICTKLKLSEGMTLLELGCGSGSFAHFVSKEYKVKVTACTHSKGEAEEARLLCDPLKVSILLCDYTKIKGKYDRVVCIQMLEHLGGKYTTFFNTVDSYLNEGGYFLLQVSVLRSPPPPLRSDPLTRKYLLSNAVTPTQEEVVKGISNNKGFDIKSIEDLGQDLLKTWEEYGRNLEESFGSLQIEEKYKKLFKLVTTAIRFLVKTGKLSMWQILVAKNSQNSFIS